jgi:quercetin dioxygenase-like cupin family protein
MKYNKDKMTFVKKGWGSELWIVNNEKYCGKILSFEKDKKFSIHYHKDKDEVFYVRKGKLKLGWCAIDEEAAKLPDLLTFAMSKLQMEILEVGDAFHIPPYRIHFALALEESEVYEFSTHHEDSDSYRLLKGD